MARWPLASAGLRWSEVKQVVIQVTRGDSRTTLTWNAVSKGGAAIDLGQVRVARQASGVGGTKVVGSRTSFDSSYERDSRTTLTWNAVSKASRCDRSRTCESGTPGHWRAGLEWLEAEQIVIQVTREDSRTTLTWNAVSKAGRCEKSGQVRVARQASGVGGTKLVGSRTSCDSSYERGLSYHSHLNAVSTAAAAIILDK